MSTWDIEGVRKVGRGSWPFSAGAEESNKACLEVHNVYIIRTIGAAIGLFPIQRSQLRGTERIDKFSIIGVYVLLIVILCFQNERLYEIEWLFFHSNSCDHRG